MKRVITATCFAMACAVGLSAQQTTGTSGTTDPQQGGQGRGGPRTVTGCLRAGDTAGTYMLTDIQMQAGGGGGTTGTTTGGGTTTTGGGGTTAGGGTAGTGGQGRGGMTTVMLSPASDVDLKPHVGHKIEVTGTYAGGRRGGDTTSGTTGGTTGGTTTTGGGTTATGGGTTAGGTGQTTTGGQGSGGARTMNVTSVRMISESCS
jgi:hypothetical protein